jgi:hypothetical protein
MSIPKVSTSLHSSASLTRRCISRPRHSGRECHKTDKIGRMLSIPGSVKVLVDQGPRTGNVIRCVHPLFWQCLLILALCLIRIPKLVERTWRAFALPCLPLQLRTVESFISVLATTFPAHPIVHLSSSVLHHATLHTHSVTEEIGQTHSHRAALVSIAHFCRAA